MYIIEIAALENGAHRNQSYHGVIPADWGETAFIREDVSNLKNIPFGEVTAEEVGGVMVMTEWTPGEMPKPVEPEPMPTMDERVTELEDENAMLKAQINAQSEQMDFYEDCIAEMAMMVYA